MLKRGWCVAFVKNDFLWGLDEDLDRKARFVEFAGKEYGLYNKCVPVGMSCGGLIGSKFAAKYPEYVSCLYLDAPVLNLLSCPAGIGEANHEYDFMSEFYNATGTNLSQLLSYREHPIDKMHILLENNIPIMLVVGDSDPVVPYIENGAVLEKFYKENGGCIEVIVKPGCAHHPHGLDDPIPIIDFVMAHAE